VKSKKKSRKVTGERHWREVRITLPGGPDLGLLNLLVELECHGIYKEERKGDEFWESMSPSGRTVHAYFLPAGFEKKLERMREYHAELGLEPDLQVRSYHESELCREWMEHNKPVRLCGEYHVCPAFPVEPAKGRKYIKLLTGLAFGNGHHPTTRLCATGLAQAVRLQGRGAKLLDVGTGTGVLAIAAARMGVGSVTGIDIDPRAVELAGYNVKINGLARRVKISDTPLEKLNGRYGIVLSNIITDTLLELSGGIAGRTQAGGTLVLSGVLRGTEEQVAECFGELGFKLLERFEEERWRSFLMRKEQDG
jgi:ribosomal protein L11 methyltransferase